MSEENKNIIFEKDIKSEKNQISIGTNLKNNFGDECYDKKTEVLKINIKVFKKLLKKDRCKHFKYLESKHRTPETLKLLPKGDYSVYFGCLDSEYKVPKTLELVPKEDRWVCFGYLNSGYKTPEVLSLVPKKDRWKCFECLDSECRTPETLNLLPKKDRWKCFEYLDSKYRAPENLSLVCKNSKALVFACYLAPEKITFENFVQYLNDKQKKKLVNNIKVYKEELDYWRQFSKEEINKKLELFNEFKGWYEQYQELKDDKKREREGEKEVKFTVKKHKRGKSGESFDFENEKARKIPRQESEIRKDEGDKEH